MYNIVALEKDETFYFYLERGTENAGGKELDDFPPLTTFSANLCTLPETIS